MTLVMGTMTERLWVSGGLRLPRFARNDGRVVLRGGFVG